MLLAVGPRHLGTHGGRVFLAEMEDVATSMPRAASLSPSATPGPFGLVMHVVGGRVGSGPLRHDAENRRVIGKVGVFARPGNCR